MIIVFVSVLVVNSFKIKFISFHVSLFLFISSRQEEERKGKERR
jgi:hypothetical protein